ncbi:MAG: aminotransferase [Piscirickettsiaceae bacterium]|nr:MAG: aminotransferase [Piscirickettsiaceae bacterium]
MNSRKLSKRVESVAPFYVMDVMTRAKTLEETGRDIVHMEVGEPDFATPMPIIQAGIKFLEKGDVHYTKAQGLVELREKISTFYQQQYNVLVSPERIFITPGASGALTVALGILLDQGDEVMMADPGYPCNSNLVTLFGGKPVMLSASSSDNYQLTAALVATAWSELSRGVMVASPSNPTGTMIDSVQMKALVNTVDAKKGFFISDEIYHGLVYQDRAVSALEYSDEVYVLNSFSKFFGMTGWRLGWLIVPEHAISAANRLVQNLYISAPTHSQYAALAAFSAETQALLIERKNEFKQRRDVLYDGLKALGFKMADKPQGAFYIYADCQAFTDDSYAFSLELLENAGVAVTPGLDFGVNGPERYLRFAYTTSLAQINLGLERIKVFLQTK